MIGLFVQVTFVSTIVLPGIPVPVTVVSLLSTGLITGAGTVVDGVVIVNAHGCDVVLVLPVASFAVTVNEYVPGAIAV
jgi:hypothetical protein